MCQFVYNHSFNYWEKMCQKNNIRTLFTTTCLFYNEFGTLEIRKNGNFIGKPIMTSLEFGSTFFPEIFIVLK